VNEGVRGPFEYWNDPGYTSAHTDLSQTLGPRGHVYFPIMILSAYSCPVRGTSHAENFLWVGKGPNAQHAKEGEVFSKEERREDKVEFAIASQPDAITNPTGSTGPVSHRLEQQFSRRGGDRPR